jgi:uncharacterized membrane-anchored protein
MSTLVAQTISNGTVSTSSENVIQGSAKAWVNFNGTGTVAIRASYNVSSITDRGTGKYTVNFTNAISDANYATVVGAAKIDGTDDANLNITNGTTSLVQTTTQVYISTGVDTGTLGDSPAVSVAVFR